MVLMLKQLRNHYLDNHISMKIEGQFDLPFTTPPQKEKREVVDPNGDLKELKKGELTALISSLNTQIIGAKRNEPEWGT